MQWQCRIGGGLAALLVGAVTAYAQEIPQPEGDVPQPGAVVPGPAPARASSGLEAESLPGELTEDIDQIHDFRFGPTAVSDVNFLMDYLRLRDLFGDTGIRSFGWVEGGYTGSSSGQGILSVQPRLNRFGNEFLAQRNRLGG